MTVEWLMPAALAGLALLAVPIAIHLFARTPVRRVVVPSLRPLVAQAPRLRRRRHLRDPWLLLLRLLVVAAAVIASAGPLITTPAREASWAGRVVRALVVDRGLAESAQGALGALIAAETGSATVAETFGADPIDGSVPLALAWLSRQGPARREIVFVGDEASVPGAEAVAAIPAGTGIRLLTVDGATVFPERRHWVGGDGDGRLRSRRIVALRVGGEVRSTTTDADPPRLPVAIRTSGGDQRLLDAVWEGVVAEGAFLRAPATWLHLEIEWTTALVAPAPTAAALTSADRAALWPMARALAAEDSPSAMALPWTALAPEVAAARRGDTLVVRVARAVEPVHAAAVLRAALFVAVGAADLPRRARLAGTEVRAAVERPALGVPADSTRFETARDGRWLWAVAVGLLAAEQWVRRRRDAARQTAGLDTGREATS